MAKRFTDTEKWKKEWFRLLPVKMKAAWEYLRDNCDQAGIWDGDFGLMSFQIGEKVSKEECESHFGPDRFSAIGEGKYLLPGFIPFQYGNLSASNKAHSGILKRVESVRVRRLSIDPPERVSGESRESLGRVSGESTDPPKGTYGNGNGRGSGEGNGNGEGKEGGGGETKNESSVPNQGWKHTPSTENLARAQQAWLSCLTAFKAGRTNLLEIEKLELARGVQRYGIVAVEMACLGYQNQKTSEKWDPAQWVDIRRMFSADNVMAHINRGVMEFNKKKREAS